MKIRKGNSFEVLYTALLADGSIIDLGAVDDLTVKLYHVFNRKSYSLDPIFEGGKLRVKVSPDLPVGDYRLVLSFKFHNESFERDPRVFSIVSNVEDEHAKQPCSSIEVHPISVSDCISGLGLPGVNGKSAYEIWLQEGFEGSPEAFLSWLKLNFDELTEEDIAVLQQPAAQAAISAGQTVTEIVRVWQTLKLQLQTSIEAANTAKNETITAKNDAVSATEAAVIAKNQATDAATNAAEKGTFAKQKGEEAAVAAQEAKDAAAAITENWIKNW